MEMSPLSLSLWKHLMAAEGLLWVWFVVLAVVNLAAFVFAPFDVRARWMALSVVLLSVIVAGMFKIYGYTRILGLGHIVVWLPLFAYLWRERGAFPERVWVNRFIVVFVVVNGISFGLDSVDVVRYLLGDRSAY